MSFCSDDEEVRERMDETKQGEEKEFVLWLLSVFSYECDSPNLHKENEHAAQLRRWAEEASQFLQSRGWP